MLGPLSLYRDELGKIYYHSRSLFGMGRVNRQPSMGSAMWSGPTSDSGAYPPYARGIVCTRVVVQRGPGLR